MYQRGYYSSGKLWCKSFQLWLIYCKVNSRNTGVHVTKCLSLMFSFFLPDYHVMISSCPARCTNGIISCKWAGITCFVTKCCCLSALDNTKSTLRPYLIPSHCQPSQHRADIINSESIQVLKWLQVECSKSKMPNRKAWRFNDDSQQKGSIYIKNSNKGLALGICRQGNTNLSSQCCWGPVRCWCPWPSPGWQFPWWPLSLWAYSSGRPGLLVSWHVWCPCSGPGPGSVRRTNNRLWESGYKVWMN